MFLVLVIVIGLQGFNCVNRVAYILQESTNLGLGNNQARIDLKACRLSPLKLGKNHRKPQQESRRCWMYMPTWSFPNALYSGIDKEEEGMSYQVFSHETYILLSSPFIIILTKISIDFQFHYCDIKTTANILCLFHLF